MATVSEALDEMLDNQRSSFSGIKTKSDRVLRNERVLLAKRLLQFFENVDEDLTAMEIRQALEEEMPA